MSYRENVLVAQDYEWCVKDPRQIKIIAIEPLEWEVAVSSSSTTATVAPPAAPPLPPLPTVQCVVCLDAPADHLVLPCGHQCGCAACLETIRGSGSRGAVCPMCRSRIEGIVRVYAAAP